MTQPINHSREYMRLITQQLQGPRTPLDTRPCRSLEEARADLAVLYSRELLTLFQVAK